MAIGYYTKISSSRSSWQCESVKGSLRSVERFHGSGNHKAGFGQVGNTIAGDKQRQTSHTCPKGIGDALGEFWPSGRIHPSADGDLLKPQPQSR